MTRLAGGSCPQQWARIRSRPLKSSLDPFTGCGRVSGRLGAGDVVTCVEKVDVFRCLVLRRRHEAGRPDALPRTNTSRSCRCAPSTTYSLGSRRLAALSTRMIANTRRSRRTCSGDPSPPGDGRYTLRSRRSRVTTGASGGCLPRTRRRRRSPSSGPRAVDRYWSGLRWGARPVLRRVCFRIAEVKCVETVAEFHVLDLVHGADPS